jgi:hypothetical protein
VRICVQNLLLILWCIILMLAAQPLACSRGSTPLKLAIERNNRDVEVLLRNVGSAE